jgi:hypothetical protein
LGGFRILLLEETNSYIEASQVNLQGSWDTFETVNKEFNSSYGRRLSKDIVYNIVGNKLNEFCERNTFEI